MFVMGNKLRNGNLAATTIYFLFVIQRTHNLLVRGSSPWGPTPKPFDKPRGF